MGIEMHSLTLLRYAGKLGHVATLGRYSNLLTARQIRAARLPDIYLREPFCEKLLIEELGALSVESYDCSNFENATYVADFNQPVSNQKQYDTILDFGTLEHIYNTAQALENMRQLCRNGGQILHCSPANNYCGHGFWQISPELFFSLYSPGNGFSNTEVFLAQPCRYKYWFKVEPPVNGQRAQISSRAPFYVLCRSTKVKSVGRIAVQQSDYLHLWDGKTIRYAGLLGHVKEKIKKHPLALRLTVPLYHRYIATLSRWNPHLTKLAIKPFLVPQGGNGLGSI